MEQNKLRAYLLYALGEILLVVIGILIALQVNNWNEDRKDLARGNTYMKRLASDLRSDTTGYRIFTEVLKDVQLYGNKALLIAEGSEERNISDWELFLAFYHASNFYEFKQNSISFEELVSTGNITLIQDYGLRSNLVYYYRDKFNEYNQLLGSPPDYVSTIREKVPIALQNYYWENCVWRNRSVISSYIINCESPIEEAKLRILVDELISDNQLIGDLRIWITDINNALPLLGDLESASSFYLGVWLKDY